MTSAAERTVVVVQGDLKCDVAQKEISRVGVEPTTGVKIKLYPHKHTTLTTELTGINSTHFFVYDY